MSVIITNMDMPKSCIECEKLCEITDIYNMDIEGNCYIKEEYMNHRHAGCPLKSIYGLADAIEQFPFTYGFASDIDRVINEYCDKENKP